MVKVLNYSQIMTLARAGFIYVGKVLYSLSESEKQYLQLNLPLSGSNSFGDDRVLMAVLDGSRAGSLVMFQPGGPPDPGIQVSPGVSSSPIPL